eukprot:jgi/Hompol1/2537/HPOL_002947-RA
MSKTSDRQLTVTPLQNAASGAMAGMISRLVISPLDVVKIRHGLACFASEQLQPSETKILRGYSTSKPASVAPSLASPAPRKYINMMQAFRTIVREEGFLGLWKGNLSAEYLYLTYGAMQFLVFHEVIDYAKTPGSVLNLSIPQAMHTFVAGAFAGIAATLATYPFDLLRTRFAVQHNNRLYNSILGAIKQIYNVEGFRGFYRGVGPTVIQIIPQMGMVFESHRFFKKLFSKLEVSSPKLHDWTKGSQEFICGGLAGMASKAATMPFDVIRKRLQVQGPVRKDIVITGVPRYSSSLGAVFQIIRHEGVLALYKGLTPALVKAAPSSAVTFFVVNECRQAFSLYNDTRVNSMK